MRWPALVAVSALVVGLGGCDKIPFLSNLTKKKAPPPDTTTQVAAAPAPEPTPDTTRAEPPPPFPLPEPRPLVDEPWYPTATGTVAPGMSRDQVVAVWGDPVAERSLGERSYLYFRNGCEVTCGTFDVVMLENNQVVDAIVRGRGHTYAGVSSSPPGRQGQMTPPGGPPGPAGGAGV